MVYNIYNLAGPPMYFVTVIKPCSYKRSIRDLRLFDQTIYCKLAITSCDVLYAHKIYDLIVAAILAWMN